MRRKWLVGFLLVVAVVLAQVSVTSAQSALLEVKNPDLSCADGCPPGPRPTID